MGHGPEGSLPLRAGRLNVAAVTAGKGSDAYRIWVETDVAAIARSHGLTGRGPVFRRRDGTVWTVFALERRRMDPWEAAASATYSAVDFRILVGFAIPAIRASWDTRKGPPGMHDFTIHAPTTSLRPPDAADWHIFNAEDLGGQNRLTELIRTGLPVALEALGPPDERAILVTKLGFARPLENLSPAEAEELLALADLAGAPELRDEISSALRRPRIPDPEQDRLIDEVLDDLIDTFGRGFQARILRPPNEDEIQAPIAGRDRSPKSRARLIGELEADRREVRRLSANALGAWEGDAEVRAALRRALDNDDEYTRVCSARSLGHIGDPESGTWRRTLDLAATTGTGSTEVAEALVLLAQLDPTTRGQEAERAIGELSVRFPADTRRLAALAALAAVAGSGADLP